MLKDNFKPVSDTSILTDDKGTPIEDKRVVVSDEAFCIAEIIEHQLEKMRLSK